MSDASRQILVHALTFAAGFLTRPCCVIPAALSVAGMSGVGIAAAIEPWRPWFLIVAVILFSVSFHSNFILNRSRPGMVVWGASALIAVTLLIGPLLSNIPTHDSSAIAMESALMGYSTITIPVEGMACTACSRRLETVLTGVEGIRKASVSYENRNAVVEYESRAVDAEAIRERIRETGFTPCRVSAAD